MRLFSLFTFAVLSAGAHAQTLTGDFDCTAAGVYTLCQNLWGASSGQGSQSTTLVKASGNSASWSTTYTWSGSPNNVKSYPNLFHTTAKGMQLSAIQSAPTSWQWNYQSASSDLRADVSYDIWTGVPSSGDPASSASSYEIMIWLSQRGGVGPIGGNVASNLQLGNHTWNLHQGSNSNWQVFSFITAEGDITNFDADLNDFFQYLVQHQGVDNTQFLQAVQTGTEPFTGSGDLVINNFSVDVQTIGSANSQTTSTHASSSSSSSSNSSFSSSSSSPSGTASSSKTTSPTSTAGSAKASTTLKTCKRRLVRRSQDQSVL